MAVFFKNECKFQHCGRSFCSLTSLVDHIETVHIDFDPRVVEQLEESNLEAVHMSYVLRFSSHRREPKQVCDFELQRRNASFGTVLGMDHATNRNASSLNLIESDSSSSNGSGSSDFPSFLPTNNFATPSLIERNYRTFPSVFRSYTRDGVSSLKCPIRGCQKIYKNINGLKYHFKNGHKSLKGDPNYTFQRFMENVPNRPLYNKLSSSLSNFMCSLAAKNTKVSAFDEYNKLFSQSVFRSSFNKQCDFKKEQFYSLGHNVTTT